MQWNFSLLNFGFINQLSFDQIRVKYNIPQTRFFRYLQIRNFMFPIDTTLRSGETHFSHTEAIFNNAV